MLGFHAQIQKEQQWQHSLTSLKDCTLCNGRETYLDYVLGSWREENASLVIPHNLIQLVYKET